MKNYEKYAEKIRGYKGSSFCRDFIVPNVLKEKDCYSVGCSLCRALQTLWLLEDYEEPEEPETDWSKVEVDTPILVRYSEDGDEEWIKRHFAKYENGKVYAWFDGCTSWSTEGHMVIWNYAKLAESEEEKNESKTNNRR